MKGNSGYSEEINKLLNDEVIVSNITKSAKQIKRTFKDWKQIQRISNSLVYGEQEEINGDMD